MKSICFGSLGLCFPRLQTKLWDYPHKHPVTSHYSYRWELCRVAFEPHLWLDLGGLAPHVVVELRALNYGRVTVMPCSQPSDEAFGDYKHPPDIRSPQSLNSSWKRQKIRVSSFSLFERVKWDALTCEDDASFKDRPRWPTLRWFASILSFSILRNDPWIVSGHPDSCPDRATTLLWDLNFWDRLTSLGFSFLICQMLALDEMVSKNLAWMTPPRFPGILLSYLNL